MHQVAEELCPSPKQSQGVEEVQEPPAARFHQKLQRQINVDPLYIRLKKGCKY